MALKADRNLRSVGVRGDEFEKQRSPAEKMGLRALISGRNVRFQPDENM
jgi:hypothetical protein